MQAEKTTPRKRKFERVTRLRYISEAKYEQFCRDRNWLERLNVGTLFIEPGSPWENGYVESLNGKFRDEFLNRELFYTLGEAQVLIERWRKEYNTFRPHSSLNYRPPAPEAIHPMPMIPGQVPEENFWSSLT